MIDIREDEVEFTVGCEAVHPDQRGGQHVAMSCTGVRAKHKPTGLSVLVTEERSQIKNKQRALSMLRAKVEATLLTSYQKVLGGLQILGSYLSAENPGAVCAEHDEIFVHGVEHDAIGGDDLARLAGMGWRWDSSLRCWKRSV